MFMYTFLHHFFDIAHENEKGDFLPHLHKLECKFFHAYKIFVPTKYAFHMCLNQSFNSDLSG